MIAGSSGRPRRPETELAILEAALAELASAGYSGFTIEGVATRAGVGRPTIYRRYPSQVELVTAAVVAALGTANPAVPDTEDVFEDVVTVMSNTVEAMRSSPLGLAVAELVGPSHRDESLRSTLDAALERRREVLRRLLERAATEYRLRVADVETGVDILLGAVWFRRLMSQRDVTMQMTRQVVQVVVDPAVV